MNDLKELAEKLHTQPILLRLTANKHGGAIGALSIPQDQKDIVLTYVRDTEQGFSGEEFTATTPFGHFFIQLGGLHSASGQLISKLNGQHQTLYDYILFANADDVVSSKTFNKVTFRYPTFIQGVPVGEDEPPSVSLFEHIKQCKRVCKDFKLDVRLSSHQRWQAFPNRRIVDYDKLDFIFEFKKPKTVNEIRATLHELNNYLAMFLQTPIKPSDVILQLKTKDKYDRPQYCFLIEKDFISTAPKSIEAKNALSFERQGKNFLKNLTNAVYNQDDFYVPLNLIRAYWVCKDRKIYLDSQVSVLLSCFEALYDLIEVPTDKQIKRESEYSDFVKELENLKLSNDLSKWLANRSSDYTQRKPFSEKVKAVVKTVNGKITNEQAEALNKLRNELMHGRLPDWNEYLKSDYEQRLDVEPNKINLDWLSWVTSSATLKLIGKSKDGVSSRTK